MTPIDRQLARSCLILVTTVCLAALFTTGCDECQPGATMCRKSRSSAFVGAATRVRRRRGQTSRVRSRVARWRRKQDASIAGNRSRSARWWWNQEPSASTVSGRIAGRDTHSGWRAVLPDTRCQMTACGGRCVVGDAPDSRCSSDSASFCDGNSRAVCECGFQKSRAPCETQLCHETTMSVSTPMGTTTVYTAGCLDR